MLAILSLLLAAQADSIEVKLVLFMSSCYGLLRVLVCDRSCCCVIGYSGDVVVVFVGVVIVSVVRVVVVIAYVRYCRHLLSLFGANQTPQRAEPLQTEPKRTTRPSMAMGR